ncbi:MAG: acyl-CoA dehydrogenase family protein [Kiritimatiellae bacterium]|nr:acyl-CoA dehydrogenase family protein [Kiritimatiellia bacterium]
MENFYKDNAEIEKTIDAIGLDEVAELCEEGFRFAGEYDFAPVDSADAIDNYKRALSICGEICARDIAPTAEETDRVGNVLNADGSVTYAPGIARAVKLLGASGLSGCTIPYCLGGLNMPCTVLTAANEIVSRADAALMNIFGLQGIAETINRFADEEIKKQYVPKLCDGTYTGAMVLTEPDAGSDLQSVKTSAWQDENGNWFVNGVKRFITNGCGDVLLVLARTEPEFSDGRGLSCLLVEKGPKVKIRRLEHKLGINGSPTCEMVFDNAPAKLVGQRKRGLITYVMSLMNGARVGISAQGTGIGEAAYRAAREYAAGRKQFGVAIEEFPAVRDLLCDMSADLQAARLLAYYSSKSVDLEDGLSKKFESLKGTPEAQAVRARMKKYAAFNKMLTPMAKYYASEMSMRVSNGALAVLGGSGYMKDYPVERYLRDARITTIYEGTSQLQIVAAIAGVAAGLYNEVIDDVLDGVDVPPNLAGFVAAARELASAVDAANEAVKNNPLGKVYHDLHARELVDAAICAVVAALFVRYASRFPEKEAVLEYWKETKFPAARAALERAKSGYSGAIGNFGRIAPACVAE